LQNSNQKSPNQKSSIFVIKTAFVEFLKDSLRAVFFYGRECDFAISEGICVGQGVRIPAE